MCKYNIFLMFIVLICCAVFLSKSYAVGQFNVTNPQERTYAPDITSEQYVPVNNSSNSSSFTSGMPSYNLQTCYPPETCSNDQTKQQITDRTKYACMCDKICSEFRDCCADSKYYNMQEQMKPSEYQCRQTDDGTGTSIYMKTSCSTKWTDPAVTEKCVASNDAQFSTSNLDITTPVTSYSTHVTYANAYCAFCNFDQNFEYWSLTINCPVEVTSALEVLEDSAGLYVVGNNSNRINCQLNLQKPPYIVEDLCSPMVSSCPPTWTNYQISLLCEQSCSVVWDTSYTNYRNMYCAYCNGVLETDLCPSTIVAGTMDMAPCNTSLTSLFNPQQQNMLEICYDTTSNSAISQVRSHFCSTNPSTMLQVASANNNPFLNWYTDAAVALSLIFLILHLIIFFAVKELRNFGSKNLASFCIALSIGYGNYLLGCVVVPGNVCFVIAVLMYYSFLVMFVGMLTMSYDLWKTFWDTKRKLQISQSGDTTFMVYLTCNWLIPLAPVAFALYLNFSGSVPEITPHFGEICCWFNSGLSLVVLFIFPVSVILIMNLIFFLHSLYIIHTSRLKSSIKDTNVFNFRLYARLALFTGITWITGFLAGILQYEPLWVVFIALNATQGVFIFIAFNCQQRVMALILNRIPILKKACMRLGINISEGSDVEMVGRVRMPESKESG